MSDIIECPLRVEPRIPAFVTIGRPFVAQFTPAPDSRIPPSVGPDERQTVSVREREICIVSNGGSRLAFVHTSNGALDGAHDSAGMLGNGQ